jgi:hypothetical protein
MDQITSPGFQLFGIRLDEELEDYDVVALGVKAILEELGPVRLGYIDQVKSEGMMLWVYEFNAAYKALELTLDQDFDQFTAWKLDMCVRQIVDLLGFYTDSRPLPADSAEVNIRYVEGLLTLPSYLPELWELLQENSQNIPVDGNGYQFSCHGHPFTVTLMKAYTIWDFKPDPDP